MTAPVTVRAFAVFAAVGLAAGLPALVLCALRRVLRRRYSAAACSRLWTGLALLLCLLPVLVFGAQALPLPELPAAATAEKTVTAQPDAAVLPEAAAGSDRTDAPPVPQAAAQQAAPDAARPASPQKNTPQTGIAVSAAGLRLVRFAAGIWLAGAAAGVLFTALHYIYWRMQCRRWAVPAEASAAAAYAAACAALRIRRAPVLQCSGWVRTPLLAGVLRPVLVLPAAPCPQAHLKLILTHELIHLQRRDVLRQLLVTAAGILYWYHPAVWLLQAAARRDAEQATDAAVLVLSADGRAAAQHSAAYGEALLHSMARARSLPLATGFSAPKKELKERMKHLFDTRPGRRGRTLTALVLCVTLLGALAAGCAANTLQVEEKSSAPLTMAENAAETPDGPAQQTAGEAAGDTDASNAAISVDIQPGVHVPEDMPDLLWPVPDSRYITEVYTGLYEHNGLDIAAAPGSSIVAADDGTVIKARYATDEKGYGTYVLLEHGNGVSTMYSHCRELLVAEGDTVKAGDVIARVGSSGSAAYSHCHFELRIQGTQTDPREAMSLPVPVLPLTGTQDGWLWPVPDLSYCSREFTGAAAHDGLDICAAYGTPVYAAAAGTVLEAEETAVGDGVYVVLDHGHGITSKYAHCSALAVQAGDTVTAGQLIAYVGCTGNSTGNHCHLQICEDGVAVDPIAYVGTLTG